VSSAAAGQAFDREPTKSVVQQQAFEVIYQFLLPS